MQNFTFGRKGLNWFLFAFILFVGSASSYGQCANVNDEDAGTTGNQQSYCYLSTIQDLLEQGTDDGDPNVAPANIEIYETATSANPIDRAELLADEATYYFGDSTDPNCTRVAVEIEVNAAPTPTNTVTNSDDGFTVTPCESSQFNGTDLLGLFSNPDSGLYTLEVYEDEFGGAEIGNYSTPLTDGASYFVGLSPNDPNTNCPSARVAVGIDVVNASAPVAESPQTFCEGATVGDLVATSNEPNFQAFRWYRSATSSTPLADDVVLVDGEDYFVSQIVNERNSIFPPCESDRTEVIVEVISFDAGADVTGEICEDDLRQRIADGEGQNILFSFITDGRTLPSTVSFDPALGTLAQQFANDPTQPIITTATFTTPEGCSDDFEFNITVNQSFNAGDDNLEGNLVCRSEFSTPATEAEVIDYLTSLLSDDAEEGGSFSNVSDITSDINAGAEGPFNSTYTVGSEAPCEDSAELQFSVNPGPELDDFALSGGVTGVELCNDDIPGLVNNIPEDVIALYLSLIPGAPEDGTFSPSIADIISDYNSNNYQTFETTYTVTVDGCSDSIVLSYTVTDGDEANAGDFNDITTPLCTSDSPLDLTSLENTDETAQTGGTFSGPGVTNNTFDPSATGAGTFTITYTVNDSQDCVDGTASTTFDISVEESPITATVNRSLCIDEAIELISNEAEGYAFVLGILEETGIETVNPFNFTGDPAAEAEELADFIANPEGSETFTFNYSTPSENTCEDGNITINITINEPQDANAGDIDDQIICFDSGMVDLNDYLAGSGASTGGTFSGTGVTDNMFNAAIGTGTYTITYSVDGNADCVTSGTSASTTFDISVDAGRELGSDIATTLCNEAIDPFLTLEDVEEYYTGLLGDNYSEEGIFTPSLSDLFDSYQENPLQTFTTQYSLGTGECADFVNLSVEVIANEPADAGDIANQTLCSSEGFIDLNTFLIGSDAIPGGTFSGPGVTDNMFDTSIGVNAEGYEITYTVDDTTPCVLDGTSDATTFFIFVEEGFSIGEDQSRDVCQAQIDDLFPNNAQVRAFYNNLLDPAVVGEGTFSPSIQSLINRYNSGDQIGAFTTVYTVTRGDCSSSVELTINVVDSLPAVIGDITDPDPICRNADDVNLFSFLPEDANPNGTFDGYEDGIFSPSMEGAGTFDITYTLTDDSPCTEGEASATFTITVLEAAYAGMDMDLSVCMDEGTQDLFSFLSVEADTTGEFTYNGDVIADGMMNPADFEAGEYEVVYTVPAINDCGGDTATFTITVEEAPGAPMVDGNPFTFCATDAPTGADLSATGTNLTYYTDEDLTTMLAAEDALTTGTYYVTQRNDEGACESEAAEITVTINDADTPTISETNPTFCEFDDATLADLTDMINETGTITWYDSADGTNALNSGTSLQDGVTYYASIFNVETGCESSVRLAVNVTIDDDCPITIPEGFSPNGDGLNDRFEIRNIGDKYPNFTIEIRNRFGDVVYKGNANTPDWDGFSTEGSFGSNVLPVGAYFYYLDYNDGSTTPVRGTVYLSR